MPAMKRRREVPEHDVHTRPKDQNIAGSFSHSDSEVFEASERPTKKTCRTLSHVRVAEPAFPRSAYQGWQPPLVVSTEAETLSELEAEYNAHHASPEQRPEYTSFTLDDFSIYQPSRPRHGRQLVTLDRLNNRDGCKEFLFDGILSFGSKRRYVQGVSFATATVDGYGDRDVTSLRGRIWIQSPQAARWNIWYLLGKPSPEYQRFFSPFIWLAEFTKYFLDYLLEFDHVTLDQFRADFYLWLQARHHSSESFQTWLKQCQLRDFRTTIAAHVGYLWKEASGIDDTKTRLCKHPIWSEVDPLKLNAISKQPNIEQNTIVTPFAYDCFKSMYFSGQLEVRPVTETTVVKELASRKEALKLTPYGASHNESVAHTPRSLPDSAIDIELDVSEGDVVCFPPSPDSRWKSASTLWYGYVQAVRQEADRTALDILWMYEPCDTTLGKAYYPFPNELFLSDNCSCGTDAVDLSCVVSKADVNWFVQDPSSCPGLFVRQKFRTVAEDDTYDFVSLQQSDFSCRCVDRVSAFEHCRRDYQIGDTVLVREYNRTLGEDCLEPAQVVDFDLDRERVVLRRLRRMSCEDPKARPNELVLTNEVSEKRPTRVIRKCYVRFFMPGTPADDLPTPYDRDGAGDYYFIFGRDDSPDTIEVAADDVESDLASGDSEGDRVGTFPPIEQGPGFTTPTPFEKLTGMGIFCGGGSFDRGLEEGGAVHFRYAIDWDEKALHSYRANTRHHVEFFLGSVSDYLAQAIAGSKEPYIAMIGGVRVLIAGSPCQGFSQLQTNRTGAQALQNASMVASVISFIDLYSPEYCILENVVTITHGMGTKKDEDVFAQILAALVGLGYQVQQFLVESWSHSSPQSRPRVFIVASAPGLAPLPPPQHSHAHPVSMSVVRKSLGRSSNGLPFGNRRNDYTVFQHVSARASTADLPYIGDSLPQLCPQFPDHRTPSEESSDSRARIAMVPTRPRGMGLVQAAEQTLLSGEPLQYYERLGHLRKKKNSTTYSRVRPDSLFPTATTMLRIHDGIHGRTLHWDEHRCTTVMEQRRAQGYPDYEVLVGTPAQQMKIIGNSVDRKASLVLGLSLRESWSTSNPKASGEPMDVAFSELSLGQEKGIDSALEAKVEQQRAMSPQETVGLQADSAHASSDLVVRDHDYDSSDSDVVFVGQRSRNLGLVRTATRSPRVVITTPTSQSEQSRRRLRLRSITSTQRRRLRTRRSDAHSN